VYFDFNEALPFPGQDGAFYQVLSCLRAFGALGVEVAGFADQNECDVVEETGSCLPDRDFHQALGARRADSLKRRLVGNGISASRITLLSFGSDRPAEPGPHEPGKVEAKDEANESLNRRVELRFY
jgi:peptidoglycan-associated lipoprotein